MPDFDLSEKAQEDFWRSIIAEHPENKDLGDYAQCGFTAGENSTQAVYGNC